MDLRRFAAKRVVPRGNLLEMQGRSLVIEGGRAVIQYVKVVQLRLDYINGKLYNSGLLSMLTLGETEIESRLSEQMVVPKPKSRFSALKLAAEWYKVGAEITTGGNLVPVFLREKREWSPTFVACFKEWVGDLPAVSEVKLKSRIEKLSPPIRDIVLSLALKLGWLTESK